MQIAIGLPVGYPGVSAKAAGIFDYLINDTFTTDRAAGAVNGTLAEPGPGRRTATDTGGNLTIATGKLSFNGTVASENPRLGWTVSFARQPGRLLTAHINLSATSKVGRVGFTNGVGGGTQHGVTFNNGGNVNCLEAAASGSRVLFTYVGATDYQVWVILRATGHLVFVKGGIFTNPTLLWVGTIDSTATLWASISQNSTGTILSDYGRVPSALWLPTPLISDGFSAWGTSDGLGHAEGIAGGLGSGGGGLAYTTVGTWVASSGVASASALSGGFAIAYRSLATADIIATVKVTRSGGDAGLLLRYTDGNNHITCHHNGTNVVLLKKVAGSSTTVQSTAATYVAGAELRVVADGTAFRVYYNNALIGSAQTISDAALQSPTNVGLYTTNTGNSFDDLVCHGRGTGGEYSALDAF